MIACLHPPNVWAPTLGGGCTHLIQVRDSTIV
jgi:hypothetical protein